MELNILNAIRCTGGGLDLLKSSVDTTTSNWEETGCRVALMTSTSEEERIMLTHERLGLHFFPSERHVSTRFSKNKL